MERLYIEETKYTPKIDFNPESQIFEIRGKSYPENTFEFYEPILSWIKEFFNSKERRDCKFNFEIIYYNSSSSKVLYDMFDVLEESVDSHSIEINWLYDEENETALEAGEDFQEDFESLNIKLVEVNG